MRAALLVLTLLFTSCGREDDEHSTAPPERTRAPFADDNLTITGTPGPVRSVDAPSGPGGRATPSGCRNSTSPSCGEFRFDPEVSDDPIAVRVTFSPRSPKVGQRVTFTLTASDPDSEHIELGTYSFDDGSRSVIPYEEVASCPRAYGPWDPPKSGDGSSSKTLRHTFDRAGTFEPVFTFYARSYSASDHPWPDRPPGDADVECIDPHRSSGKADAVVKVTEHT